MSKVIVIPRDEEAIEKARKESGWRVNAHAPEGLPRRRLMLIPEDNWDYEHIPAFGDDGAYTG